MTPSLRSSSPSISSPASSSPSFSSASASAAAATRSRSFVCAISFVALRIVESASWTDENEKQATYLLKTPFVLLPQAKHFPVLEYRLTAQAASK